MVIVLYRSSFTPICWGYKDDDMLRWYTMFALRVPAVGFVPLHSTTKLVKNDEIKKFMVYYRCRDVILMLIRVTFVLVGL